MTEGIDVAVGDGVAEAVEEALLQHGQHGEEPHAEGDVEVAEVGEADDGPDDIGLDQFETLLGNKDLKEVILATNTTVEVEATAHYISEMVKAHSLKVSRIAHGVPMGGELEFVNSMTIVHALDGRKVI